MTKDQIIEILQSHEVLINEGTGDCAIDPMDYHRIATEIHQKQEEEEEELYQAIRTQLQIIRALVSSKSVRNLDESIAYYESLLKKQEGK